MVCRRRQFAVRAWRCIGRVFAGSAIAGSGVRGRNRAAVFAKSHDRRVKRRSYHGFDVMNRLIVALLAAAVIGAGSAPSRAATVVQQPDASAELIGTEVLVQAGLDRQTVRQNGLAALVAESVLQTPV